MFAYTKIMQGIQAVSAAVTDAYFNLVTLLLPGNGTNGAQNNTFLDSSSNNFTITRNGNTTQGTFSPFSQTGWSNYTASGYLTTAANAGFALSGDFTVEAWVYSGDSSLDGTTRRRIFHTGGGDIANALQLVLGTSGGNSAVISVLSNSFLIDGTINVVTNSWVHVAVTRSGTSLRLFVNGVQSGSTATTSQNFNSGTSNTVYIGANSSGAGLWQGYISNLRVLVGTAAYTSGFTPPTTAFATGTTNQQLLVCASNNFADINTATNAKAITVNSTPSVQAFSPFAPTAAYSAATNGGSGYFDGTGDYLTGPNASGGDFSTGSFTISCWFYPTTLSSGTDYGVLAYADASGWNGWQLLARGTTKDMKFEFLSGSAGVSTITGGTITLNAWNYVVVVRSGSAVNLYVNSTTSAASATNSSAYGVSTSKVVIGADRLSSSAFAGYISNVKLVKQANTPSSIPTAPDTNTTNTSLLLNYTNAGITDATAKNDLETVGNAQISTTQSKFGGSSMYFDGTGDYLAMPATKPLLFGTAPFTIEGWIYLTSTGIEQFIYSFSYTSSNFQFYVTSGNKLRYTRGATVLITGTSTLSANTWYHVALVRTGTGTNGLTIYLNGTSEGSATEATDFSGTGTVNVGQFVGGGDYELNGYIDDFRVTSGYARYTTTFTPPTAAFPLS